MSIPLITEMLSQIVSPSFKESKSILKSGTFEVEMRLPSGMIVDQPTNPLIR